MNPTESPLQEIRNASHRRAVSMDVIRCFALLCVVGEHFFLNSGFYEQIVAGRNMLILVSLRSFFMVCVPLFLLLSGYLLHQKTPCRSYYKRVFRILGVYLLSCGACILYRFFFHRDSFSVYRSIRGIFNFYASEYGWYIKMYLGLFLLIPFLNVLYHHLDSQKQKKVLVLSLLFLTAAPSVLNIWRFHDGGWWTNPASSADFDIIVPDWWIRIYPITYYMIGCYLREYPLRLKKKNTLLLSALCFIVAGLFNFYRSHDTVFVQGIWEDNGSALVLIQSVLVFHFLGSFSYSKISERLAKLLSYGSKLCMGAYLCSWIFDDLFYPLLNRWETRMHFRLYYFPLIVPAVFLCSLGLSAAVNGIYDLLNKLSTRKHSSDT